MNEPSETDLEKAATEAVVRIYLRLQDTTFAYQDLPNRDGVLTHVHDFSWLVEGDGIIEFLRRGSDDISAALEAFQAIGAVGAYEYLKSVCDLFPGGMPSDDWNKMNQQISDILGDKQEIEELIAPCKIDTNLHLLLLSYWKTHGPQVTVDLANVTTAAELLATLAQGLGLEGEFGNSLDKFFSAIEKNNAAPGRLILKDWECARRKMPVDAEVLLREWKSIGEAWPELACKIDLA